MISNVMVGLLTGGFVSWLFYKLGRADTEAIGRRGLLLSAIMRLKEMTPTSQERVLHGYGLRDTAHWFACLAETMELTGFMDGGIALRTLVADMNAQANNPSPNEQQTAEGEAKKEEWIAHIKRQCDELERPMTRMKSILPPWAYSFMESQLQ